MRTVMGVAILDFWEFFSPFQISLRLKIMKFHLKIHPKLVNYKGNYWFLR